MRKPKDIDITPMHKIISQKEAELIIQRESAHHNICFLTGAGISKIHPANLTLGYELKNKLIELITAKKKFKRYRDRIMTLPKYRSAIPELIFQPIYECLGERIYSVFECLKSENFNHIHAKLGWYHSTKGASIYTTNFDTLIEQASTSPIHVEHLHGSIDRPEDMIIRIYQVGRGIRKNISNQFKLKNKGKVLLVLGYSGNDKDIMTLLNHTDFKRIVWLIRDAKDKPSLENLQKLTRHSTLVFQADLNHFLKEKNYSKPTKPANLPAALSLLPTITDVEAWKCLQAIFFTLENFYDALEVSNRVLSSSKIVLDSKDQSWFRQVTADNLNRIGIDFRKAIYLMKSAIRINTRHGNKLELAEAHSALGNIYNQKKRPDTAKALLHLKEAEQVASGIEVSKLSAVERDQLYVLLGKIYNNMGLCYDHEKEYSKAIYCYKMSMKFKNKTGNITAIAVTQANLALAYKSLESRKYSSWAKEAERTFIEYGLYFRLGYLYRELGGRSVDRNKADALNYLTKAMDVYRDYMHDAVMDKFLTERYLKRAGKM